MLEVKKERRVKERLKNNIEALYIFDIMPQFIYRPLAQANKTISHLQKPVSGGDVAIGTQNSISLDEFKEKRVEPRHKLSGAIHEKLMKLNVDDEQKKKKRKEMKPIVFSL